MEAVRFCVDLSASSHLLADGALETSDTLHSFPLPSALKDAGGHRKVVLVGDSLCLGGLGGLGGGCFFVLVFVFFPP